MLTVSLPGFEDITKDSQRTFRTLLEALAAPGVSKSVEVNLHPPDGITTACAAACLTLLDLETTVWLQSGISNPLKGWLQFHTGCLFVEAAEEAAFAIIHDADALELEQFCWGSDRTPEASTTLLIQSTESNDKTSVNLTGPGILNERHVVSSLPKRFWQQWQQNNAAYPRGIDIFLFSETSVMGLPRTAHAQLGE